MFCASNEKLVKNDQSVLAKYFEHILFVLFGDFIWNPAEEADFGCDLYFRIHSFFFTTIIPPVQN